MKEFLFGIGFFVVLPALCWAPALVPHLLARRKGHRMPLFSALYYQLAAFGAAIGLTLGGIGGLFIFLFAPLLGFALPLMLQGYADLAWIWTAVFAGFATGALAPLCAAWLLKHKTKCHILRWAVLPTLLCGWVASLCLTSLIVENEITARAQQAGLSCLRSQGFLSSLRDSQTNASKHPHATAIRGRDYLQWSHTERAFYVSFTADNDLKCTKSD